MRDVVGLTDVVPRCWASCRQEDSKDQNIAKRVAEGGGFMVFDRVEADSVEVNEAAQPFEALLSRLQNVFDDTQTRLTLLRSELEYTARLAFFQIDDPDTEALLMPDGSIRVIDWEEGHLRVPLTFKYKAIVNGLVRDRMSKATLLSTGLPPVLNWVRSLWPLFDPVKQADLLGGFKSYLESLNGEFCDAWLRAKD